MKEKEPISKKLMALDGFLVIMIIWMFFVLDGVLNKPVVKKIVADEPKEYISNAFNNIELDAKSAYVFDVANNSVIYRKNEFVQLPLASLTKLMMALTATELLPSNSKITIKKEFLSEEGDSGLLANESWKLKELLDFSLVVSSNDGARSIASVIGAMDLSTNDYDLGRKDFVKKMNENAQKLELKQTYFTNENGLDNGEISGGYGSAIDVSNLLQYMLKNYPDILEATKYESLNFSSLDNKKHLAVNTNVDVNQIPGLIASKTGYTDMAGGNLAIAYDSSIGRPIIIVVLGSTIDGRFTDVSKLVNASKNYIQGN